MLEQIIYTRCSPYRDISRRGEIKGRDGLGVFSFSNDFFNKCSEEDINLLKHRIAERNGAKEPGKNERRKEIGLFNSYESISLPSGSNAFIFEVARPQCIEPTKGGRFHRGGNFIKQCLVGTFSRNITELFESSIWDAYLHDDNFYYLDDVVHPEIQILPQKDERIYEIGLPEESVDQFIDQNRLFLLQKGLSFLLHEMRKPVEKRKVLLIKDTSSNVELWIRAMLRLFPPYLANSISFSTNVTSLDINADSRLFYYTDYYGRFLEQGYSNADAIRHPYCLITGYHPLDDKCRSLRQTPNSCFYMIDGEKRSTTIPDEYSSNQVFYKEAFCEENYSWFRETVLSNLKGIQLSDDIPGLYEASRYLLRQENSSGWRYGQVLSSLSVLGKYGTFSDRKQNQILFEKISGFIVNNDEKDVNNEFAISSLARQYGQMAGYEKPISKLLADGIRKRMTVYDSTDYESIRKHLCGIQDKTFQSEILEELFSDSYLQEYTSLFQTFPAHKVSAILDLFYLKLETCDGGLNCILSNTEKKDLVYKGIYALIDSEDYAVSCLKRLNGFPTLYCDVVSSIARGVEKYKPLKIAEWWKIVGSSSGNNIVQLCSGLCNTKGMSLHGIEYLLCCRIREAGKYREDDFKSFENSYKILPHKEGDGKSLFSLIISYLNPNDVPILVRRIRNMQMGKVTEKELFYKLDQKLGIPDGGKNNSTYIAMCEWGRITGYNSIYCACTDLHDSICSVNDKAEDASAIRRFIDARIPYSSAFQNSDWISDIFIAASSWHNVTIHGIVLDMFLFKNKEQHLSYIHKYFVDSLKQAEKKEQVSLMESFCELFCIVDSSGAGQNRAVSLYTSGVTAQEVEKAFTDAVYEIFKSSMLKLAEKYSFASPRTGQKLLGILYSIENQKNENKIRFPFRFFRK